jgi:hypothetical protein
MSVGFPFTKAEVDSRAGQLSMTLRDNLQQIRNFKAALDTKSDVELQNAPFAYSQGEVATLRSALVDLVNLAAEYTGRDHLEPAVLGYSVGEAGTATGTSATTLTRSSATWTGSAWVGRRVVAASGVYGVIQANTATVLTIDQWNNPATPAGAAGTTPAATTVYAIMPAYDYRTFAKQLTGVL